MDKPLRLITIAEMMERLSKSRSYIYEKVLPHLECVKQGATTAATDASFEVYLAGLPRVTFKQSEAA